MAFALFMYLQKVDYPIDATVFSLVLFLAINIALSVVTIILFMYLYPLAVWMLIQIYRET